MRRFSRHDDFSRKVESDHANIILAKTSNECEKSEALVAALVKMGFILGYFYVCDRTNFFMKENK